MPPYVILHPLLKNIECMPPSNNKTSLFKHPPNTNAPVMLRAWRKERLEWQRPIH